MITPSMIQAITDHAAAFTLVLSRIASIFASIVFLRREVFPAQISILLAMSLAFFTVLVLPLGQQLQDVAYPVILFNMVLQTFLGFLVAFIFNIFVEVFISLGQLIAQQSGLGFMNLYLPRVGSISPFAVFFMIMATLIFFELNGHLVLMQMIVRSFEPHLLIIGHLNAALLQEIVVFVKIIFSGALLLSLSVMIAILISNLTLGVMTKFAPQLNVFSVGINISLLICFFAMYISFDLILENGRILLQDILNFLANVERSIIN